MGYLRTMGAGLAGSLTKTYGNANVNQIQYGNKLQGLPPVTGRRDPYKKIKAKAGGNAKQRSRVFCVNQLGGVGMGGKNSPFAPNADGVGWCPNPKNSRQGNVGINVVDRGNNAIRFQNRATEKKDFKVYCKFTNKEVSDINSNLSNLRKQLEEDHGDSMIIAAMGDFERIKNDIANSNLSDNEKRDLEERINKAKPLQEVIPDDNELIKSINAIIGKPCLWVNRKDNGRNSYLGQHRLVVITKDDKDKLRLAGYGVNYIDLNLEFYSCNYSSKKEQQSVNNGPNCGNFCDELSEDIMEVGEAVGAAV